MLLCRSRVSAGLTLNVGPESCDTSSFESAPLTSFQTVEDLARSQCAIHRATVDNVHCSQIYPRKSIVP